MQRSAIIVAGGSGRRMGANTPKQFLLLGGQPMLLRTVRAFHRFDPAMQVVVVLPVEHIALWEDLCRKQGEHLPHTVVPGGSERFHSVQQGLKQVPHNGLVGVHDGVRPLVSQRLIARCFKAAEEHGAAIPAIPVNSSVRRLDEKGSHAVDRDELCIVQTPQCFRVPLLREAFELPYDPAFTDEATLVERLGRSVALVEGEQRNIKITTPTDLQVAEALCQAGE